MAIGPVEGDSTIATQAGITGRNTAPKGTAILGTSLDTYSIVGQGKGVEGHGLTGVHGESVHGFGVRGILGAPAREDYPDPAGVVGESRTGVGVKGVSATGVGVVGETYAENAVGIYGQNDARGTGVSGGCDAGTGVLGRSKTGRGVWGTSDSFIATVGDSDSGTGVWGHSRSGVGVYGQSDEGSDGVTGRSESGSGVAGLSSRGTGVYGRSDHGKAGYFDGNVTVTGDICLENADCAEDFDVVDIADATPGTVMVLDDCGAVRASDQPYDTRVAGVVSGAGRFRPGIILDRGSLASIRAPLALMGKVYCKVDAGYGSIVVGDLLTTSATRGHAMKASNRPRAFGAVIGKALEGLTQGTALIPILVGMR